MIDASCDSCFRSYQLKDEFAGRKVRCKGCGEVFTVPQPGAAAADPWDSEDPFDEDPFTDGPAAAPPSPTRRKKKRKKKAQRESSSGFPLGVYGILGIAAGALFLMMCFVGIFFRPAMHLMLIGVGLTGAVLSIVGGVGCLMAAFEEDTMIGVMYLIIPFYPLYFAVTRIGDVWKLVLMNVGGGLIMVAAIVVSGMVQAFDESRDRAAGRDPGAPAGGGGLFANIMAAAAQDEDSSENLRAITMGMHDHDEVYNQFAPRPEEQGGTPLVSWQTSLLPFVDEQALYDRIDRTIDWNAPANSAANGTVVDRYRQPSIRETTDSQGFALSHYALNQHFLVETGGLRIRDITDGTSNTMLAGEVGGGYKPWADPSNARDLAAGLAPGPATFGNPSGEGAFVSLADGSVRWLSSDTDPNVLTALSTPSAGDLPF